MIWMANGIGNYLKMLLSLPEREREKSTVRNGNGMCRCVGREEEILTSLFDLNMA